MKRYTYGKIMAEAHIAIRASQIETLPLCPLCGEPMDYNGAAYFCYNNRDEHLSWLDSRREAAYRYQENGGVVFWNDIELSPRVRAKHVTWDPSLQGVIIAVAIRDGKKIAEFGTVRGGYGKTNFRVEYENIEGEIIDLDVPPRPDEWAFADWASPPAPGGKPG